ncbi:nuclear transport factor 2 family protein [Paractinoplanes toevensis]|uniref:SnoaL-like domain-containing protein n=1 Tax=Paractinoplanes toevensis TaxID=571911 RepID=A0A919T785_9ACTN|nr:nuclear transport factor 2 family protein [Actinoplanes toevensis]GIM89977.1 hypothetical protein Ato02nite_017700 [Actinoplanes toevensis]
MTEAQDIVAIRQAVQDWAVWRDAGRWDRYATLWHSDGHMTATWFPGPQPIYEKDRLDPVAPDAVLGLDQARLRRWPEGYAHLAYLQEEAGFTVTDGLPGLTGAAVEHLYREGDAWLEGARSPWIRA